MTFRDEEVNFLLKKFKVFPIFIVLHILTTPGFELEVYLLKKSKLIVSKWSLITSIAEVFTDPLGNNGNGPSCSNYYYSFADGPYILESIVINSFSHQFLWYG